MRCVIDSVLDAYGDGTCVHVYLFGLGAGVESDGLVGEGGVGFFGDCAIALGFDAVDVVKCALSMGFIDYPVHI